MFLSDPVRPAPRARRSSALAALALAVLAALAPASARADLGPLSGTLGVDHLDASAGQSTWKPSAELDLDLAAASASLAASSFDDNVDGHAWSITGALAFPIAPRTKLSLAGTGFAGDSVSGAWRVKAGPQFALPLDRTLDLYAQHYDDDLGASADAVGAELDSPLVPHLSGSLGLALQRTQGENGADASLGLSWQPRDLFELVADGDWSAHASGLTIGLPSRKALQSARAVGRSRKAGTTTTETIPSSATFSIGVRVHF